jgi:hypothetical protein
LNYNTPKPKIFPIKTGSRQVWIDTIVSYFPSERAAIEK